MGDLTLRGATSGSITLSPTAVAGTNTITLPASTGTVALTASPTFTGTVTATTVTSPSATALTIQSAGTTAMTVDTSQNVGIGTTSPTAKLAVNGGTGNSQIRWEVNTSTYAKEVITNAAQNAYLYKLHDALYYRWDVGGSEAMRIDSSGNLLVGATSGFSDKISGFNATNSGWAVSGNNSTTTGSKYGIISRFTAAAPNDTNSFFYFGNDNAATRFYVLANGGIANYSANNVNLSDQRMKKDIQLAGSYLDKICAIPVKTFLYNDQTDEELNLGVIAQDVDAVAPELIDHSGWKDKDGEATDYLSIYQTDLQYALMKCIQELSAKNDALEARLAALEAK